MDFDKKRSAYVLVKKEGGNDFIDLPVGIPTVSVFRDLETDSVFVRKRFGGEDFPIAEKAKRIRWKYTNERMDIAGCACRRANGLFMDSVYVVAFFCPYIDVPSGPSLFGGLPGIILGVSIPQEHVNVFAIEIVFERPSIERESMKNRSEQKTFSTLGEYLKVLVGNRFDASQWDMNMRGLHF